MQASAIGATRPVTTAQADVHPRLEDVVRTHAASLWRRPPHRPSVDAFNALAKLLRPGEVDRLVLDAGCGTGHGTRALAEAHAGSVIVGVDRSEARLRRTGHRFWPAREGRIVWVRADLATFWRLARAAGWRLQAHYLLYPNPWPKAAQLRRRWHAHPVFPDLLALGGELVMRCNWEVYAREFALAAGWLRGIEVRPSRCRAARPLTPFERKYAASGHALFEVRVPGGSGKRT